MEDNEEAMGVVAMEEAATNNVVDMEARGVSVGAIRVVNITAEDMVAVAGEVMQQDQVVMVGVAVEASKETMKIQYLLETLEMLISVQLKTSSVGLA